MLVHSAKSIRSLKSLTQCSWNYLLRCSYSDSIPKKSKLAPLQERRMIDRFNLHAKGGNGGSGCSSIHRSMKDRRGKPDGGNGGRGGDVVLECSPTVWDFSSLQHHVTAGRGGHGTSKNKIGTRGSDKVIHVPVGTVIHLVRGEIPSPSTEDHRSSKDLDPWEIPGSLTDDGTTNKNSTISSSSTEIHSTSAEHSVHPVASQDSDSEISGSEGETRQGQETMYSVAELIEQGQRMTVGQGGEGGLGSVSLSKRSKLEIKKPNPDQSGLPGSEAVLVLELKSIADVSLVGIPNSGKSTLLGAISRAKPLVGDYAFTTLRPNLGNLSFDGLSITVADVPGLISGAHEDRGLGHAFLRHVERTRVIAYVVDLAATLGGRNGIPPWEQLRDLVSELEHHQQGLSARPSLVVANKIDEDGACQVYEELKARVVGVSIYPVCAVLEEGIPKLKAGLRSLVDGGISECLEIDKIMVD